MDSREINKRRLEKGLIDSRALSEERESGHGKNRNKRRLIVALILFLFLAAVFFFFYTDSKRIRYSMKEEILAPYGGKSGYLQYIPYSEGFLRVTRDGVSYIDKTGAEIWNQAYEINEPHSSVNGDFAIVSDTDGTKIYIMDQSGLTGTCYTSMPVLKADVSRQGIVYALLSDGNAGLIKVYGRDGKVIDISIRSLLKDDGYPLDLSVSDDGTELIVSYVYLEDNIIKNRVVFYNMDIGDAGSKMVVGGFEEDFSEHIAGVVNFSDNTYAQAFNTGGVVFFSTKVLNSPEKIGKLDLTDNIRSIACSGTVTALVTENTDASIEEPFTLRVFTAEGKELFSKPFRMNYTSIQISGKKIFLYGGRELLVFDLKGNVNFKGSTENSIFGIRAVGNSFLIGSENGVIKARPE